MTQHSGGENSGNPPHVPCAHPFTWSGLVSSQPARPSHRKRPRISPAPCREYDPTKPYPAYTAPRTAWGAPDLMGVPVERIADAADPRGRIQGQGRLLRAGRRQARRRCSPPPRSRRATSRPIRTRRRILSPKRPSSVLSSGLAAQLGGYDRGWLDPGNHVMRVNGEPRTSLITTATGSPPAKKANAPTLADKRQKLYRAAG